MDGSAPPAGWLGPSFDSPREAFADWWKQADHEQLRHTAATDPHDLPDRPRAADFVRDGHSYRWVVDTDRWLQVDIDHPREAGAIASDRWTVVGVNRCGRA